MADCILDASALAKAVVPEPGSDRVTAILREGADGVADVFGLDVAVIECTNVLWKRQQRGELEHWEALQGVRDLELAIEFITVLEAIPHLERALEIAMALSIAVYDATALACAEGLGVTLVTEDRRQAEVAARLSPPVKVELLTPANHSGV